MRTRYSMVLATVIIVALSPLVAFTQYESVSTNLVRCFTGDTVWVTTYPVGTNTYEAWDAEASIWTTCYVEIYSQITVSNDLPEGLSHTGYPQTLIITNGPECAGFRTVVDVAYYSITGRICTSAINTQCVFYVHGQFSREDEIIEDTYLYTVIQVDDYANDPDDHQGRESPHIGTLSPLSTWSETAGFNNGYLFPAFSVVARGSMYSVASDVDVLSVSNGPGVYCIETRVAGSLGQSPAYPLDVSVYTKDGFSCGEQLASIKTFNVFETNGIIDGHTQRLYFQTSNSANCYVVLQLSNDDHAILYQMRMFKARGVVCIHAIGKGGPITTPYTDAEDTYFHLRRTAPYDRIMYPCKVYSFVWNHKEELFDSGPSSTIGRRCEQYISSVYTSHGDIPVTLLTLSSGSLIGRWIQEQADPRRWSRCIYIGPPHYGSDLALTPLKDLLTIQDGQMADIIDTYIGKTLIQNIDALARGSSYVMAMSGWARDIDDKTLCIIGTNNCHRFKYLALGYSRGLEFSDAVVPATSANLRSISSSVSLSYHNLNHTELMRDNTSHPTYTSQQLICDEVYHVIRQFMNGE